MKPVRPGFLGLFWRFLNFSQKQGRGWAQNPEQGFEVFGISDFHKQGLWGFTFLASTSLSSHVCSFSLESFPFRIEDRRATDISETNQKKKSWYHDVISFFFFTHQDSMQQASMETARQWDMASMLQIWPSPLNPSMVFAISRGKTSWHFALEASSLLEPTGYIDSSRTEIPVG